MRPLTKVPNADINEPGDRATAAKLADGEMSPLCMKNDESHLYTAPPKTRKHKRSCFYVIV